MTRGLLLPTGAIVAVAAALTEESATLVAVTVTSVATETLGAAYIPLEEILPGLADHVTAVLLVLLTLAVNCCTAPEEIVTVAGETETLTCDPVRDTDSESTPLPWPWWRSVTSIVNA
jgi:hypothetical protein